MKIVTITDLDQAQKLWEQCVQSPSWYNQWDIRKLFFLTKGYADVAFYVVTEHDLPIALLPLQLSKKSRTLEFFGGRFFEDNQVWGISEEAKQILYQSLGGSINLDSILPSDHNYDQRIELGDEKFVLPLQGYTDGSDYLQLFSSKRRNNLRRAFKKLTKNNLEITVGQPSDLEHLFALNIQRFGEESIFNDEKHSNCFREMLSLPYDWRIYTFTIHKKVEAVSLGVLLHNTYIYHNAGTNVAAYPNLGSMVIHHNIAMAIEGKADYFDAGSEDLGWKSRWHLNPIQLYKLTN
jgi:hypothetical protein